MNISFKRIVEQTILLILLIIAKGKKYVYSGMSVAIGYRNVDMAQYFICNVDKAMYNVTKLNILLASFCELKCKYYSKTIDFIVWQKLVC